MRTPLTTLSLCSVRTSSVGLLQPTATPQLIGHALCSRPHTGQVEHAHQDAGEHRHTATENHDHASLFRTDIEAVYCFRTGDAHARTPQLGHFANFRPPKLCGRNAAAKGERLKV